MSLESALRRNDPTLDPASRNEAAECDEPDRSLLAGHESERTGDSPPRNNSVPQELRQELVMGSGDRQTDLETVDLRQANPTIFPAMGAQTETPIPVQIISKFSDFTQDTLMGYQWIRAHENRGAYDTRVFARLPTYQQVFSLIEPIVESLQHHGAAITLESFKSLMDEQYSAGPDSYADNPARWAIINSFFGTAMLTRSTTDFLKEITPTAWNYFKNAFQMFPELITKGQDVLACEALLSMVMFVQCTADAQLTLQVTAAATRLVQALGLHRRRFYLSLDPIAAQRHHRVFWVAYILDVDALEKYDLSPSLAAEEMAVAFEQYDSHRDTIDSGNIDSLSLLRWRAELAVIQRQIHERLNPVRTPHMKDDELVETVRSIGEQLQAWKRNIPKRIWTIQHDDESDFTLSIAHLHCVFYNAVSRVHMAIVHLRVSERTQIDQIFDPGKRSLEAQIQKAWTTCLVSARNMVEVVVNLTSQPFFQLWYGEGFPWAQIDLE